MQIDTYIIAIRKGGIEDVDRDVDIVEMRDVAVENIEQHRTSFIVDINSAVTDVSDWQRHPITVWDEHSSRT